MTVKISYRFVPMGTVAEPQSGRVYLDVGNQLVPGVIDHHHPSAPDECTTGLVLAHPDYVVGQVRRDANRARLELVTHLFPDMDAASAAFFAARLARAEPLGEIAQRWAAYVRRIDQGYTRLSVARAVTPYAVMLVRSQRIAQAAAGTDPENISRGMLKAAHECLEWILAHLESVASPDDLSAELRTAGCFNEDIALIEEDIARYQADRGRAQTFRVALPTTDGGQACAPGIWVDQPASRLFKSWARGDVEGAHDHRGFVFTGVQVTKTRFILAVAPGSGVWLKGLGDRLEREEALERQRLGRERKGAPRPGYASPDPWYDGRSALHAFTIIDSPREGTVLNAATVWRIFQEYVGRDVKLLSTG